MAVKGRPRMWVTYVDEIMVNIIQSKLTCRWSKPFFLLRPFGNKRRSSLMPASVQQILHSRVSSHFDNTYHWEKELSEKISKRKRNSWTYQCLFSKTSLTRWNGTTFLSLFPNRTETKLWLFERNGWSELSKRVMGTLILLEVRASKLSRENEGVRNLQSLPTPHTLSQQSENTLSNPHSTNILTHTPSQPQPFTKTPPLPSQCQLPIHSHSRQRAGMNLWRVMKEMSLAKRTRFAVAKGGAVRQERRQRAD